MYTTVFKAGVVAFLLDLLQFVDSFFQGLVLIVAQEGGRDGIWKPQCAHGSGVNRTLRALFVDHDPNDLDIIRGIELLEHFLRIGHLRDRFRGDERYRIDVLETRADQGFQVVGLQVGGDGQFQALPSVAGTFD